MLCGLHTLRSPAQWNWGTCFLASHSAVQLRGTSGANITGKGNSFLYSVIVTMCCRKRPGHTAPRNRLHTVPVTAPPLMEHHPLKPTTTPNRTRCTQDSSQCKARLVPLSASSHQVLWNTGGVKMPGYP